MKICDTLRTFNSYESVRERETERPVSSHFPRTAAKYTDRDMTRRGACKSFFHIHSLHTHNNKMRNEYARIYDRIQKRKKVNSINRIFLLTFYALVGMK